MSASTGGCGIGSSADRFLDRKFTDNVRSCRMFGGERQEEGRTW